MQKIAMAIHGGAGPDYDLLRNNIREYEACLRDALSETYKILEKGGTAINAVEEAVRLLEDYPLFNAGRGSALNNKGEVQMDAAIMDGKTLNAGAVAIVQNVKNPITLARYIMDYSDHVLLSGKGAFEVAKQAGIELETAAYFITQHQYDAFMDQRDEKSVQQLIKQKMHGTVGAVALDKNGNIAAATSTGGATNSLDGRIGDSCILGAGCYANNRSCAVSGTGDGELLIKGVIGHAVSAAVEYTAHTLQQACDDVIHSAQTISNGDIGVISVNVHGDIGISFNSQRMLRAWVSDDIPLQVKIYKAA